MKRNAAPHPRSLAALLLSALFLLPLLLLPLQASDQRYDYDEAGRLIRSIDEQGRVTEYRYDVVGNILQVIGDGVAVPPTLDAFTPGRINHDETLPAVAAGGGLGGARITTSHPGLRVSGAITSDSRVTFDLHADPTLPLGPHAVTFTTAAGSAVADLEVRPEPPTVYVTPTPLGVLPGGAARPFLLWLSHADVVDHDFTLTVADPALAAVDTATLTVPAGRTEARANLSGLAEGVTRLTVTSTTPGAALDTLAVPIYVSDQLAGINTTHAALVGVEVERAAEPPAPRPVENLAAAHLGVIHGGAVTAIEPPTLIIDSGPQPLTVRGHGLHGATRLELIPADGLLLGPLSVAADGRSATASVSVAADAPLGLRQLVLRDAEDAPYPVTPAGADRLRVTPPPPLVEWVAPLHLRPGIAEQSLTIGGRNLDNLYAIDITPSEGITLGGTPEIGVNGDGQTLTTPIAIAPDAALGPRVVTVTTAAGTTDSAAGPQNTVHLVLESGDTYPNLNAVPVGVVVERLPEPVARDYRAYSRPLGVVHGAIVTGLNPTTGAVGTSFTLTVEGNGLTEGATIEFIPADGILMEGAPLASVDGHTLSVPLTITDDAPIIERAIRVRTADGSPVPLSDPAVGKFRVTVPPPEIHSVSPLHLIADGNAASLTLRGVNFADLSEARILPTDGVTLGLPELNADATELTLPVTVAAGSAVGPRTVQLVTLGGASDATPTPANTVTVTDAPPTQFGPITGSLVGVIKELPAEPIATEYPAYAPHLGVVMTILPPSDTRDAQLHATRLGVTVGPVALGISIDGALAGSGHLLAVSGHQLDGVSDVRIDPADGITTAPALDIAVDGSSVTFAYDIAADAPAGLRRVQLLDAAGEPIPYGDPAAGRFYVAAAPPLILSIDPILAGHGDVVSLLIRGEGLNGAQRVTATPAEGINVGPVPTINADGSELTVPLHVAPDAPLGPRVIQVHLPGGIASRADAVPANTFTVYTDVP